MKIADDHESQFTPGEIVEIIGGPFTKFTGMIEAVHDQTQLLTLIVSIFGRKTPVEAHFQMVRKRPDLNFGNRPARG